MDNGWSHTTPHGDHTPCALDNMFVCYGENVTYTMFLVDCCLLEIVLCFLFIV